MSAIGSVQGWETRYLREVVTKLVDGSHNPPPKQETGLPMLSARNVDRGQVLFDDYRLISESAFVSENARTRITAGDVLLTIVGTIGRAAVVPEGMQPFSLQRSVAVLSPTQNLLPKFLCYQLQSPAIQKHFEANARGTAQKGVYLKTLGQTPISLPSVAVQAEIVAEIEKQFSRLDEAVANLKRVKANLKRYTDSVYADVFGSAPNSTLGDLIDEGPQNGLYLPKEMYGKGVPILRIDDYQTACIRPLAELRRVNASPEQISTWALREGDLVINRVNSMTHLGKCALIPSWLSGAVFESNMMRMRLLAEASSKYVEHYLASRLGKTRLTENAKWAVNQASINQKDVRATQIFLPDLAVQYQVVADIDRRLSIIKGVETEVDANLKHARALRQATLQKMFGAS